MGLTDPQPARLGLELFRLDGRVAVVTGGTKGLGHAIAEGFAAAGADVVVISRHGDDARGVAAELSARFHHRGLGLEADVSDEVAVTSAVGRTLDRLGRLDILVNSAAVTVRGALEDVSREDFDQAWGINVVGTWLMCRAALPIMRAAGGGRLINLSSTAGVVGASERSAYAATKGAVIQLTKSIALECATDGITANVIAPGPFITPMNAPVANTERLRRVIGTEVAMRRWGELHEIQGAAIYLASDASSYVTGAVLMVDGGMTAR